MPRIVPLELLNCLTVLLDVNGGILSAQEVKRLAGLMTKYSKKLVSKCIYVQILKCTKTELLGEFMGVGGWALVHAWLHDSIRAMNWPLVQEILELLLLSPVDVDRLKLNTAPKLVKGLCKDGGTESVRILAKRLVEQWLKIVTENTATIAPSTAPTTTTAANAEQATESGENIVKQANATTGSTTTEQPSPSAKVYKIMIKSGNNILSTIEKSSNDTKAEDENESDEDDDDDEEELEEDETDSADVPVTNNAASNCVVENSIIEEDGENSNLSDKQERTSNEESSDAEDDVDAEIITPDSPIIVSKNIKNATKKGSLVAKKDVNDKIKITKKESKTSKDDNRQKDKIKKSDRRSTIQSDMRDDSPSQISIASSTSSTSTTTSSSSTQQTKTSSSKTGSSSSNKLKSSSSNRSSNDKHRSDRERSSSSKDKTDREKAERSSSSLSSKHKSSKSSSSKDRYRDKEREKSSSSSSRREKEREKEYQPSGEKDKLSKTPVVLLTKLSKNPKKSKDKEENIEPTKPTSISIPSKKASMSIEKRDSGEKANTVKTYKSQFRSHGLTEMAPPPPSRKSLKRLSSNTTAASVVPNSLPSSAFKRSSPPPTSPTPTSGAAATSPSNADTSAEKRAKIELISIGTQVEKPGAIKLIPAKKIPKLVETNIFSDALSAATDPKKPTKRKRHAPTGKEAGATAGVTSPPISPADGPKCAPLKFYQDTLSGETKPTDAQKSNKENEKQNVDGIEIEDEDDDDVPLKKVKEDIEKNNEKIIELNGDDTNTTENSDETKEDENSNSNEPKEPGPGCGPNGPPGVLVLNRRKGPKKKLSWKPAEALEEIRYFTVFEHERVNVSKPQSFMDMKNLERCGERDAIHNARRGLNQPDCMEPKTDWRPLIPVDDVPQHPNGNLSKQRIIQAEREALTLRALYFTASIIPDSPAEAELEPHYAHEVPLIPLDDLTGNPDAVNDFTSMPWPESRGTLDEEDEDVIVMTASVSKSVKKSTADTYMVANLLTNNNKFNSFGPQFNGPSGSGGIHPQHVGMKNMQQQQPHEQHMQQHHHDTAPPPPKMCVPTIHDIINNGSPSNWSPNHMNGPPNTPMRGHGMMGVNHPMMNDGPHMGNPNNLPPSNFLQQNGFIPGPGMGPVGPPPFMQNGPPQFNPNFGPNGPMMNGGLPIPPPQQQMNMNNGGGGGGGGSSRGGRGNRHNNNGNGGNNNNGSGGWRVAGGPKYPDNLNGVHNNNNNNGGGGSGNWRPGGSGGSRGNNNGGGGGGGCNNNGVCKAFMRGHCRLGKSCKYIHPKHNKRI